MLHSEQSASSGASEAATGPKDCVFELSKAREHMGVESPIRDGLVTDWELFEKLWEHSVVKYCGKSSYNLKDTPVLLSEKPYTSSASRHR